MRRLLPVLLLVATTVVAPWPIAGQGRTASPALQSPLEGVSWLTGRWVGTTGSGAFIEESWMGARDGLMLGSFRWDQGNGRWLFEFMSVEADPASPGTLVLRLKHFDRGLRGFEEKAESTTFRTTAVEPSRVVFELRREQGVVQLTYARTGDDALIVTYDEAETGKPATRIEFSYKRAE